MLLNRLKHHLDPYIAEEQAELRKDRSTVHLILFLRLLAEKAKRNGKKLYNCFVDFQNAFDTVKHSIIWAVLRSYGVENKLVRLLQQIYKKSKAAVRIGTDISEWYPINIGTRQGDPLSSTLFITYLERVMEAAIQEDSGANISGTLVNNLRFADDIILLNEDCCSLHNQVEQIIKAAGRARLMVNIALTKTMVFGDKHIGKKIQIADTTIENVEKFEYLGSVVTWDNDCSEKIKQRVNKAVGVMSSLKHIWSTKKLKVESKLKLLKICVFSVLLYASET